MNPQDRVHSPEDDDRLLEYLDGQIPAPGARAIEAHVAVCAKCQALRGQWEQLEERLARTLAQPRLSADFATRLRQQVAAEAKADAQNARLQEKDWSQTQVMPIWAETGRRGSGALWLDLLDVLGYGAAAAVGGYVLSHLTAAWAPGLASTGDAFLRSRAFLFAVVSAGAVLAVGLNLAAKNKVKRWLRAF